MAKFKANVLNSFVAESGVRSVIEFGSGDGNQLRRARYPQYLGFDVSEEAVERCTKLFCKDPAKSFRLMRDYAGEQADLAISLDVIYHLVEDAIFERYMGTLFDASLRHVIIYSSNTNDNRGYEGTHVRHRKFTDWVEQNRPGWKLVRHVANPHPYRGDHTKGSFADFYIYEKA